MDLLSAREPVLPAQGTRPAIVSAQIRSFDRYAREKGSGHAGTFTLTLVFAREDPLSTIRDSPPTASPASGPEGSYSSQGRCTTTVPGIYQTPRFVTTCT